MKSGPPQTVQTIDLPGRSSLSAGKQSGFTAVGNRLYFSGFVSERHRLHWIDVTSEAPSIQTLDIQSDHYYFGAGEDGGFVAVGDRLFFSAFDLEHGWELRWIDTTLNTPTLHTIDINPGNNGSNPGEGGGFITVGDKEIKGKGVLLSLQGNLVSLTDPNSLVH